MSPEDTFGRTWETACYFTWYPQTTMGTTEKVWTFFMVALIGEVFELRNNFFNYHAIFQLFLGACA